MMTTPCGVPHAHVMAGCPDRDPSIDAGRQGQELLRFQGARLVQPNDVFATILPTKHDGILRVSQIGTCL